MKIIGIADGSYTSKKDSQRKEGFRFYVTDEHRQGVTGQACEEIWVRAGIAADFLHQFPDLASVVGHQVVFLYNRFRSVEAIMPMPVVAAKK